MTLAQRHVPGARRLAALLPWPRAGSARADLLGFLGAVAVTRFLILGVVALVVSGQEFTNDVDEHMYMVRHPLHLLLGQGNSIDSPYPPLLGAAEGIFAYPLQLVLPDFYAARITYIIYEIALAAAVWLCVRALVGDERRRGWIKLGYLVLPMGWVTSAVMAQEEEMAALVIALAIWLVAERRWRAALILAGVGVVAVKIYLLIPLVALVLLAPYDRLWRRALFGFGPVVLVYGWAFVAAAIHGGATPLVDFTPPNYNGVNAWQFVVMHYDVTAAQAKQWSSRLAALGALAPLLLYRLRRPSADPLALAGLIAAALLWAFILFYHVNPEYNLLLLPPLLLIVRTRLEIALLVAVMSVPWLVNFVWGVEEAEFKGYGGGRRVFIDIYQAIFPSGTVVFDVVLCINVAVTVALAVVVTRSVLRTAPRVAAHAPAIVR